ncbi:DYRK-family kinase [Podosphaera aphanis]|nr:DYRK-family kinase [Podosphaera aphanis]
MDPPNSSLNSRNRRLTQYPPLTASSASNVAKATKKVGSSSGESEVNKVFSKRRSTIVIGSQGAADSVNLNTETNVGGNLDGPKGPAVAIPARDKSVMSLSKCAKSSTASTGASNHQKTSSSASRFQGRSSERGTTPSSSRKRMSVIPGVSTQSHASGLGARTISPTDARRAKRLSILQGRPPIPQTPSTSQPDSNTRRRPTSSPPTLPTKVPTLSSSRTTPELNRKSYSSGLSAISATSYHSSRESTGSLQPRLLQYSSSSRLPTNKPRCLQDSARNEEEEFVPPVPAIPKAYESPKEFRGDSNTFSKRKSSLPIDSSSIHSISTNDTSGWPSPREIPKNSKEPVPSKAEEIGLHIKPDPDVTPVKITLQPLQLPPFNLRPLSTATLIKVEAPREINPVKEHISTLHQMPVTPSSPMTASKSSFFSRNSVDENCSKKNSVHSRSNSAIHFFPTAPSLNFSEVSMSNTANQGSRNTLSPFLSSSLPKNGGAHLFLPRSKTIGDFHVVKTAPETQRPPRLAGPRTLNLNARSAAEESPSTQLPSPEEPLTPSSSSSLRRKLSLGWKRSASKSSSSISHAAIERDSAYPTQTIKYDNMPPPRLPTSVVINNLNGDNIPSPSLSVKSATYLDFRRRKNSVSSLSMFSGYHDRTRSDSWGLPISPNKNSKTKTNRPAPTIRTTSVMHKMLNPKSSSNVNRSTDQWTGDLDKDDLSAEDEIKKLASKRKDTEHAARHLDALRKRATAKESVSPQHALRHANLNIFERGEIVDYKEVYFCGTSDVLKHVGELSTDTINFGYDDERGDYSIIPGDHLSYRYEIVDLLGRGSFGQVVRCVDHKTGGLVAVKIIRNKKRFHQQALVEVNILQKLRDWDPNNKFSMVNFTQSFYFRGHLCISTELLDMNLYEFIKSNSFRGFSLKIVRRFTKQILNSLLLLQQHKVIHCDLKPENVLLAHPLHSEIKVIDFGSSCFENEKIYTYIQSRFYRSPEVILGMTYGMPIDMWSLGCIMAELYSGVPIFPGENEQEQLACIMEIFGPPEKHLIEKSTRRKLFFDSQGKPRLTVSSKGRRRRPSSKTLQQVLKCDDEAFLSFLSKCLKWDPERRMKPDDAIRHEFITGQKPLLTSGASRLSSTTRNDSPIKRHATIATLPGNRPLPDPPAPGLNNSTSTRNREVASSRESPNKSTSMTGSRQRRKSIINGSFTPLVSKRTSMIGHRATSTTGTSASALPRATRNVSGKADPPNSISNQSQGFSSTSGIAVNSSGAAIEARRI